MTASRIPPLCWRTHRKTLFAVVLFYALICSRAGCEVLYSRIVGSREDSTGAYIFPLPDSAKSCIIDIGLYNTITRPQPSEFVIGIDASLREIEKFKLWTMCEQIGACLLINAAVGRKKMQPFVDLKQSERGGGSSHITNFDATVWPMELRPAVVPFLSMKTIIDSVPRHLPINLCKIDTNGNDIFVIESAGDSLRRCLCLVMEIVGPEDGTGPPDQYERALKRTARLGFVIDARHPSRKQLKGSYNLYFVRPEAAASPETYEIST